MDDRINAFKNDLTALSPIDIARRHVVFGDCAVIDPDEYFRLRSIVAVQYELHPNDVLVVAVSYTHLTLPTTPYV